MTMVSAAYIAEKALLAAYGTNNRSFFSYAHYSTLGNYIGLFEVFNLLGVLTVPFVLAFGAAFSSYQMWERYNKIMESGKTLTKIEGFKYMLVICLKGATVWVAGLTIGTSAADLLSFYDTYNVTQETSHCDSDGNNCTEDSKGTSLLIDLIYHELTTWGLVAAAGVFIYLFDENWVDWMA